MKELHMSPEFREAIQRLYDELRETPDSDNIRQILDLAFQMDEKGEFWKFKEVFGSSELNSPHEASEV